MAGRRLLLALVLLMTALLTTIPSNAFKVTGVGNLGQITVSQSDIAGLAVGVSSGNSVNQVTYAGGQVQVHFGKGNGGAVYSLQTTRSQANLTVAADDIKMFNVLNIKNNSGSCQDVAVYVSAGTATNLTNIYGRPPGGAKPGTLLGASNRTRKLQPAGQMVVDFYWIATTASAQGNFTLTIKGTRSATCP
jgi:hypothetical protein